MAGQLVIAAAARVIDGEGSLSDVIEARERLEDRGARVGEYRIAPLRFGWDAPLPEGYHRSACAPIEGLLAAREGIAAGNLDALLISGADPIKSEFGGRAEERDRLMQVYGERTFLNAYDELAGAVRARLSMTRSEFEELAACLFENYWRTWTARDPDAARPAPQWFEKVTPHFRGVDCANPNIDFEGAMLVASEEQAPAAGCGADGGVVVRGASLKQQCDDGIEHIPEIVSYQHLAAAYEEACEQAGLDFGALLLDGRARLEVYSCFPPVPIGFFLATGLARDADHLKALLGRHPATITGGLNLGRAPWNNSTLNAMVQATEMIRAGTPVIGIHSNAALGYKQGFSVLTAPTAERG